MYHFFISLVQVHQLVPTEQYLIKTVVVDPYFVGSMIPNNPMSSLTEERKGENQIASLTLGKTKAHKV